jgi:hypothetical protein
MRKGEPVGAFLVVLAVLLGAFILCIYLARLVGCNCHKCGGRMTTWARLSSDEQAEIAKYYRDRERRSPDTKAFFVCRRCGFIYDDFSGERLSLEGDETGYCKVCGRLTVNYLALLTADDMKRAVRENPGLVAQHECLRCECAPVPSTCAMCDTPRKLLGCRYCVTLYEWQTPEGSKFQFFVPLTDKPLCDKPSTRVLADA